MCRANYNIVLQNTFGRYARYHTSKSPVYAQMVKLAIFLLDVTSFIYFLTLLVIQVDSSVEQKIEGCNYNHKVLLKTKKTMTVIEYL